MLGENQVLFTYLHLAAEPDQTAGLVQSGAIAIAYETVTDARGGLPLLTPVSEVAGTDVDQVMIGSCTNGAYEDILPAAKMFEGREIDKRTDMIVAPGSKQSSELLARRFVNTHRRNIERQ